MRGMNEDPQQDPELKAKAHRAQMILYGAMVFFLLLPFVVFWIRRM
jgi:hypothetical protein